MAMHFARPTAFFPGLQVLFGDVSAAGQTAQVFANVWRAFGMLPERYDVLTENMVDPQVCGRTCACVCVSVGG